MNAPRIPLTVIGGYLGAGKTTLLNRILLGDHGRRLAVIVNDFGDVNVDESLLADADGGIRALANGCVCCQAVDGLATALGEIAALDPRPEHVLIEASGVSDPLAIAQWGRSPGYELDGVIVVVDPSQIEMWSDDRYVGTTVIGQLASADLLVLSRGDTTSEIELNRVTKWLADYSRAEVLVGPNVALEVLLGPKSAGEQTPHPHAEHSASSIVPREMTRAEVEMWLAAAPSDVVRVKGFVGTGAELLLVQRVGPRAEVTRVASERDPVLTVIGRAPVLSDLAIQWISTIAENPDPQ